MTFFLIPSLETPFFPSSLLLLFVAGCCCYCCCLVRAKRDKGCMCILCHAYKGGSFALMQ